MIRAYVAMAMGLLALGTAAAEPQSSRLPVRVGVVFGRGTCRVLQLSGPAVSVGTVVQVVRVAAGPTSQSVTEARVVRARSCLDGAGGPVRGHRVTLELGDAGTADLAPGEMAIGVVEPPRPIEVVEGKATTDLDGDGTAERFRACTSSEGVHLTVWSGEPLVGARRWHAYQYLGHETSPNCEAGDWRDFAGATGRAGTNDPPTVFDGPVLAMSGGEFTIRSIPRSRYLPGPWPPSSPDAGSTRSSRSLPCSVPGSSRSRSSTAARVSARRSRSGW